MGLGGERILHCCRCSCVVKRQAKSSRYRLGFPKRFFLVSSYCIQAIYIYLNLCHMGHVLNNNLYSF